MNDIDSETRLLRLVDLFGASDERFAFNNSPVALKRHSSDTLHAGTNAKIDFRSSTRRWLFGCDLVLNRHYRAEGSIYSSLVGTDDDDARAVIMVFKLR